MVDIVSLVCDVYLLVVYVCPENSPFSSRAGDIFQLIEAYIANLENALSSEILTEGQPQN